MELDLGTAPPLHLPEGVMGPSLSLICTIVKTLCALMRPGRTL